MSKGFWLPALVLVFAISLGVAQTTNSSLGSNTNAPSGAQGAGSPANVDQPGGGSGAGTARADSGESGISSGELQSQIQNALSKEPTLANDHLDVSVSDDQIELSGAVTTAREKLSAQRIVQSYAGNRKVKDQVKVSGHSRAASQLR